MNGGSSFATSFPQSASARDSADVTMADSNSNGDSYYSGPTVDQRGEYWKDDFRPLRDTGKEVLQMLRRDETSVHGDLYRRIMSTNPSGRIGNGGIGSSTNSSSTMAAAAASNADSNPAHRYFSSDEAGNNSSRNGNDTDTNIDVVGPIKHSQTIPLPPYLSEVRS